MYYERIYFIQFLSGIFYWLAFAYGKGSFLHPFVSVFLWKLLSSHSQVFTFIQWQIEDTQIQDTKSLMFTFNLEMMQKSEKKKQYNEQVHCREYSDSGPKYLGIGISVCM